VRTAYLAEPSPAEQARLVGSLQHPLVIGDFPKAPLRELAPSYERLRAALS
jgi:hypothetical protein